MLYNSNFLNAVNPSYIDNVGCDIFNYTKQTNPEMNIPNTISLPEQNVSCFLESLANDWETLHPDIQNEYYKKLNSFLSNKTENTPQGIDYLKSDNSLNIQKIAIIVFLVLIGAGLFFLFVYSDKFSYFKLN